MPLTGISPNDPIPSTRRELIFGAGLSSGGLDRRVLLYGNRTSAGTETVNVLGTAILDDADAQARFGARSELYNMYRLYAAVDSGATIHGIAVTESAGTAAACTLTVANAAILNCTLEITITGVPIYVTVTAGDAAATIAANIETAINNADEGKLQVTAATVAAVCTVTAVHAGPRGDYIIGDSVSRGIRTRFITPPAVAPATLTTVTKGALTPGATEDDFTAAYNQAALDEFYYHVNASSTTGGGGGTLGSVYAVTAVDNGVGEGMGMIITQALPINGKSQCMIFGLVGTQADATLVAADAQANSVRGFFFRGENLDWTPAMIAAHHAAIMRSQQVAHPSANFAGYTSTDNTIYRTPAPFLNSDRPGQVEIRADLENGISPIGVRPNGRTYLVRHVTSRSENANGDKEYRARPGHVTSAIDFAWEVVKARWETSKQPFAADNPKDGEQPTARTTTPLIIDGMVRGVIDDLSSSKPLGRYDGPILAPDQVNAMKKSLKVSKIPAGISVSVDFVAVQHLYKGEFTIRETGEAY